MTVMIRTARSDEAAILSGLAWCPKDYWGDLDECLNACKEPCFIQDWDIIIKI